jgi:hypothetical protein
MRLWSLHPKYLDTKGLLALWREGLLAQKVLRGKTKGYRHHPQLSRFSAHPSPRAAIQWYLFQVWAESKRRNYSFQKRKVSRAKKTSAMTVTRGQLQYEWGHLRKKLRRRSPGSLKFLPSRNLVKPHPSFRVVAGKVEEWEKIN